MKCIKNILMVVGLFLLVGVSFASKEGSREHQLIQKNQDHQAKSEKIDRVVVGEIVLIRIPSDSEQPKDIYSYIATECFKRAGYEIEVAPGEIELEIGVKYNYADLSEEDREMISDDWDSYSHPRLERFFSLPLHLFLNEKGELKDEAEEVIIYYNNKQTHERIKVVLTIRTADIVAMSDFVDCSKVHYIVRDEGYRSKMQSYLDKNPKFINASLGK